MYLWGGTGPRAGGGNHVTYAWGGGKKEGGPPPPPPPHTHTHTHQTDTFFSGYGVKFPFFGFHSPSKDSRQLNKVVCKTRHRRHHVPNESTRHHSRSFPPSRSKNKPIKETFKFRLTTAPALTHPCLTFSNISKIFFLVLEEL